MNNQKINTSNWINSIIELLSKARESAVRAVNQTMVYTYFEIGRIIVEEEQNGQERAEYGKQVLKELSNRLTLEFGKGFSVENLDRMRYFYKTYASAISSTPLTISETLSRKSEKDFVLSWSHYLKLMRIADAEEPSFYEVEVASNNWSLREMIRQIDSELYTRLAFVIPSN
jgi:predicted nuclease of restriction endonuclease-like (RecB) superfamily